MQLYPDYSHSNKRQVSLTGESYAGKYIPYFAARIHQELSDKLSLTNLIIGNPYTSPVNQRTQTYKVGAALNVIDEYNLPQISALRRRCEKAVSTDLLNSGDNCTDTLDYVLGVGGGLFDKDARYFDYEWQAGAFKQPYQDYFNKTAKLQQIFESIHIDKSTKRPVFEPQSARVSANLDSDSMIDYMAWLDFKVGEKSPNILIYAG